MKSSITFILLSAALAALLTGCGFKSDLYLSDITPVPETVITDFPPLPTLPPADGSANPDSVVVEIPPLEDEAEKKNTN
jgi:predicted small lipoprotein YifL